MVRFLQGPPVRSTDEWETVGRPDAMARLRQIYGQTSPTLPVRAQIDDTTRFDLASGSGLCTQSTLTLSTRLGSWACTVAAFSPLQTPRATVVGLNFRGNHTILADERIRVWRETGFGGAMHYENAESFPPHARGSQAHRWPVADIVGRGYAVVTFCYLQCGPDTRGLFSTGPHRILGGPLYDQRAPRDWGAIGVWAWCLSRLRELVQDGRLPGTEPSPVIAFGHSRLGKTALWAAAQDTAFAGAISNNSGAMGAALSRDVGENPRLLSDVRPYWFAAQFTDDLDADRPLPADQWELLAAIAPRILLVGSAAEDLPADPEGELLATERAMQTWLLDGGHPPVRRTGPRLVPTRDVRVGYHRRPGGHDVLPEDWTAYLDGLDAALG